MTGPTPPARRANRYRFTRHGITIEDPYHWLRDPDISRRQRSGNSRLPRSRECLLRCRNGAAPGAGRTLFAELKARQQPDEAAVPWKDGALRISMALRQRRAVPHLDSAGRSASPTQDQTILDEPALANGHDYFSLGGLDVSPERALSRVRTDTDGSERYTLHIKDLDTGELLDRHARPAPAAAPCGRTTTRRCSTSMLTENWQPYLVKSHRLGDSRTTPDRDIYEEAERHVLRQRRAKRSPRRSF